MKIELRTEDITKLAVDAIVNAANERLLGSGGVYLDRVPADAQCEPLA